MPPPSTAIEQLLPMLLAASTPGNIDVAAQPRVQNPDGSVSNVRSLSFNDGGAETLVPTVSPDSPGLIMTDQQAIDRYLRTGQHLGQFGTPEDATRYAQALHNEQAAIGGAPNAAARVASPVVDAVRGVAPPRPSWMGQAGGPSAPMQGSDIANLLAAADQGQQQYAQSTAPTQYADLTGVGAAAQANPALRPPQAGPEVPAPPTVSAVDRLAFDVTDAVTDAIGPKTPIGTDAREGEVPVREGAYAQVDALQTDQSNLGDTTRPTMVGGEPGLERVEGGMVDDQRGDTLIESPQAAVTDWYARQGITGDAVVQDYIERGIRNHRNGVRPSFDPNMPSFDEGVGRQLATNWRPAGTPSTRRPQVNPNRMGIDMEVTQQGPIDPALAAAAAQANAQLETQRRVRDKAESMQIEDQAARMQDLAAAQQTVAADQEQRAQAARAEMDQRLARLDSTIESVRNGQVDPNRFFGGFGGRMGAAIAVALGQLGSALGGGENAALGIIMSAINRDIAAQEANLQQGRAALGAEQNALSQFRSILGDDEAARRAAEAAALTAVTTRLNSMQLGSDAATHDARRRLQAATDAAAQAARAAAASGANVRVTRRYHEERTIPSGTTDRAVALQQHAQTQSAHRFLATQEITARLQDKRTQAETLGNILTSLPELLSDTTEARVRGAGDLTSVMEALPEGDPVRAQLESARNQVIDSVAESVNGAYIGDGIIDTTARGRAIRQRRAAGQSTRAMERTSRARYEQVRRSVAIPVLGEGGLTPAGRQELLDRLGETGVPDPPAGTMFLPGGARRFQQAISTRGEAAYNAMLERATRAKRITEFTRRLAEARSTALAGYIGNVDSNVWRTLRQDGLMLMMEMRHPIAGAALTEREADEWNSLMEEAGNLSIAGLMKPEWDSVMRSWAATASGYVNGTESELANWGLRWNSAAGRAWANEQGIYRQLTRRPATPPQPAAPIMSTDPQMSRPPTDAELANMSTPEG